MHYTAPASADQPEFAAMLETIRNAAQTWIAKVILALITVPFALWGVESYIRTGPANDEIVRVGNEKITSLEFNNAVRNQLDQFRAQFGSIDPKLLDNPEMRKSILDQLIDQRLLTQAIRIAGVKVGDKTLQDRLLNEPSLQEDGHFSVTRYDTFVKSQGQTQRGFEALLRQDMARAAFVESISNTAFTSNVSVQQYLAASEQAREVAVLNIAPEPFLDQVKITPEQVKADYETRKNDFTTPEQVRAEYVELSLDALAPHIQIAAEQIKAHYEGNLSRFVQKEERKASHILISVAEKASDADKASAKAKALDLYAQVKKSPASFSDLAKKHSQDPGSGANGGDLGFFPRGAMVPAFDAAVFGAKAGDLLGPIETGFGFHIIKVTEIRPAKGKSLAEATPEIESELKKQEAQRQFAQMAEKFSNAAYEQSTSLKGAAEVANLPIRQAPFMAKTGAALPPFNNPKLAAALFSDEVLKNKRNTEAVEITPNTLVVARAIESKPAVLRPFAEVEAGIKARLMREEANKLAKADGEAKLALLREGKTNDVKFPATVTITRASPAGLPGNAVDVALKANTKTLPAFVGTERVGGGYTLVRVSKVIDAAVSDEAKIKSTHDRVAQAVNGQQLQSLLVQVRGKVDVVIAKDALEKKAEN